MTSPTNKTYRRLSMPQRSSNTSNSRVKWMPIRFDNLGLGLTVRSSSSRRWLPINRNPNLTLKRLCLWMQTTSIVTQHHLQRLPLHYSITQISPFLTTMATWCPRQPTQPLCRLTIRFHMVGSTTTTMSTLYIKMILRLSFVIARIIHFGGYRAAWKLMTGKPTCCHISKSSSNDSSSSNKGSNNNNNKETNLNLFESVSAY